MKIKNAVGIAGIIILAPAVLVPVAFVAFVAVSPWIVFGRWLLGY
jgi:hypothetical protein